MKRILAVFALAALLGALGAAVAWAAAGNADEAGLVPRPRIVPTVAESRAAQPAPIDASKRLVSEVWVDDDYTSGTPGWGIDHFATIQAGVNAASPGGTVRVAAGVYPEHDILVDKHLALLGAGAATTFIDGGDLVVAQPGGTGILLSGATAGVGATELTGFTLRNPARFATGFGYNESYSVRLTGGQVGATYRLHDLVFQGDNDYDNLADFGFYSHGDAGASLEFDHNTIFNHTSNPILVEVHRGPTNIHHNTITTVGTAYAAYYMTYSGADVTTLQRIADNTIDASTSVPGIGSASGIGFTSGFFNDYIGRYDRVEISNNTITGLGAGRRGVSLYNGALSSAAASEIGRVSCVLTGNSFTGTGVATSQGVRLLGLVSNAALSGNRMYALTVGLLSTGAAGNYPAGVVAQNGSFGGNGMNVINDNAGSTLNASGNWWGTVSPAGVAASVSAGVDYTPWLNADGDLSTLWVSASGPQVGTTGRVQEAVNLVSGSTVNLLAGTYVEQVEITRNVTLIGEGPTTVIQSPLTLALSYVTGSSTNKPIVYVHNTANAVLRNLTVDGAGRGNLNYRFQGVGFWNAGGALIDCAVVNVADTPFSGAQHGVGVYAYNNTSGPYSLALTNVNITGFQKNATALSGNGLTVAMSNVTATGAGPTAVTAQNGIQIGYGAGGTVDGCTVSGIHYTGTSAAATGLLLLYGGYPVVVTNTQLLQNQVNAYFIGTSGSFSGTVTGASATNAYDGIYLYNDGLGKAAPGGQRPLPQPYDAPAAPKADKAANMTVAIANSTITGAAVPGMGGIAVWGSANSIALSAANNTITNWDYGIYTYEELTGNVTAACQNNNILGNAYGFYSNISPAADARHCWWGSITGPQHLTLNPAGLGNEVSDNVLFEPWTGQASLAIAPATSGPLTCAGSQLLSFDYTPDPLSPAVKGYSVTVETDAALTFDDSDVHFTTLPTGATMINPVVTEVTAGHKYILDYAVLFPASTGFTGPATLFTVNVHAAGEGTGTVHMSDLAFRDVDNAPIPVGATGDAVITVDCTAPDGVATVTASPGHRQVKVDWTASASTDLAGYEVWRAKWHRASVAVSAYPEYDDYGDAILPTPPAAYGSWNGGEWVLAATVPAGTLTCTDTGDTNRGVYYYEVFAKDTAGNYSLPAVAIDRATNYWLGDVRHEGVGDYDGIVAVVDISLLGHFYGTTVPLLDPAAVAAKVDVGPTDDMSRKGIPRTDSRINFEDLMVFAMNYGPSGPPAKILDPAMGGSVTLTWARLDDLTWSLRLAEACAGLRGVNVAAALPQGVAARVEPGALLSGQSGPTFVKNINANGLDAGLAIFGENAAIAGTGELMRVATTAAADLSGIAVIARGTDNGNLEVRLGAAADAPTPMAFRLSPNVPNPFNPKTRIAFALPTSASVRLAVYALDGSLVRTLARGELAAGNHEVEWDGRDDAGRTMASGSYLCRIEAGTFSQTRKMTLMK